MLYTIVYTMIYTIVFTMIYTIVYITLWYISWYVPDVSPNLQDCVCLVAPYPYNPKTADQFDVKKDMDIS